MLGIYQKQINMRHILYPFSPITWEKIGYIDGLVQERRNAITSALELSLSCNNPLICNVYSHWLISNSRDRIVMHAKPSANWYAYHVHSITCIFAFINILFDIYGYNGNPRKMPTIKIHLNIFVICLLILLMLCLPGEGIPGTKDHLLVFLTGFTVLAFGNGRNKYKLTGYRYIGMSSPAVPHVKYFSWPNGTLNSHINSTNPCGRGTSLFCDIRIESRWGHTEANIKMSAAYFTNSHG